MKISRIATGCHHSFVGLENGDIYSFGCNDEGQLGIGDTVDKSSPQKMNFEGKKVSKISASWKHSLILMGNSTN